MNALTAVMKMRAGIMRMNRTSLDMNECATIGCQAEPEADCRLVLKAEANSFDESDEDELLLLLDVVCALEDLFDCSANGVAGGDGF